MYRQPIITIMGHIDSGKTTFLDNIKGSKIASKEAGKITQHIGATEIPYDVIQDLSKHLFEKYKFDISIPGLLFIDTPGHNAFDNLRERGGSLADLVVLVVDINKGLQAQDVETLEILKMYKIPFIVLANKIDLIRGYYQETKKYIDLKNQSKDVLDTLDEKLYKLVGQLYDKGFQAERFDRVTDFKKQIVIIPTSAEKGYGMSESILFLAALTQKFLDKRIEIGSNQKPKGTILELAEVTGMGSAADVILYQGILNVKQKISFLTKSGIVSSKIKALLKPDVMSAVDKKSKFISVNSVSAATGVKIVAPNLNECFPGSVIVDSEDLEAVENLKNKSLGCIVNQEVEGAFIKADTLGSLEALKKLLEKNNICVSKADIGKVTNKDVLELKVINQRNPKKGVFILFNSILPKDLELELEKEKIPVFKNNIIYKLIEDYQEWLDKQNQKEQQDLLKNIVFPAKIKILKNHIFRASKPAIVGVKVLAGKLISKTKLLKNQKEIGFLESIQSEGKKLNELEKDQEAAISIKNASFLKDFQEEDVLEVYIPKQSLENLKNLNYEFDDDELELIENAKKLHK